MTATAKTSTPQMPRRKSIPLPPWLSRQLLHSLRMPMIPLQNLISARGCIGMNEGFIKGIDRCCKTLALDFSGAGYFSFEDSYLKGY